MKKANVNRILFGGIYIIGGIINLITILWNVEIYRTWKDTALISLYNGLCLTYQLIH